jgi:hypothetical protein
VATKPGELRQQVSGLRKRLQALLGIDADPFHPTRKGRGYRARFAIRSAAPAAYPTPPGTTWDAVSLTAVSPGVVEVSVTTARAGAVFVQADDPDGGGRWEASSAAGDRCRRYHLAELGLTGPAGEALAELLRTGGRVLRPGTDRPMLDLGRALSAFFQLADPPFTYSRPRRTWVARFEAASIVSPSDR